MNTNAKAELAAVAPTQSAVDAMAVVTLSPEKYAAEVYQPFKAQLADAIDSVRAIEYDIKTTVGMAVAVKCRALFRDMRVAADKERKARKEPITKIGKLLESGFDQVEERITPLEEMFDADIKAEEARKEAEKQAKIAAERARVEAIEARIQVIRNAPLGLVGKSSSEIAAARDSVRDMIIGEELFGERAFRDKAMQARSDAFNALEAAHAAAVEAEEAAAAAEEARRAEAARIEAERAELARLRAEQVERERLAKIETDRIAAEQAAEAKRLADLAAAQEAELRRQREAEDARVRAEQAERDRVAAETKRQLDAQQAAIAAERAEFARVQEEARQRAEDAARLESDHAEALPMNVQFDADREADRVRLQALADQAAIDARERATDERKAGLPAGSLRPESYSAADEAIDASTDPLSDAEIIENAAATFGLTLAEATERLDRIDFVKARERLAA